MFKLRSGCRQQVVGGGTCGAWQRCYAACRARKQYRRCRGLHQGHLPTYVRSSPFCLTQLIRLSLAGVPTQHVHTVLSDPAFLAAHAKTLRQLEGIDLDYLGADEGLLRPLLGVTSLRATTCGPALRCVCVRARARARASPKAGQDK